LAEIRISADFLLSYLSSIEVGAVADLVIKAEILNFSSPTTSSFPGSSSKQMIVISSSIDYRGILNVSFHFGVFPPPSIALVLYA
jgi:hypothetical protein